MTGYGIITGSETRSCLLGDAAVTVVIQAVTAVTWSGSLGKAGARGFKEEELLELTSFMEDVRVEAATLHSSGEELGIICCTRLLGL